MGLDFNWCPNKTRIFHASATIFVAKQGKKVVQAYIIGF
ncbi:MAG: hypothetical protein ACJAUO_001353 [Sediminicola sp.]|jgi:hypothetical protein